MTSHTTQLFGTLLVPDEYIFMFCAVQVHFILYIYSIRMSLPVIGGIACWCTQIYRPPWDTSAPLILKAAVAWYNYNILWQFNKMWFFEVCLCSWLLWCVCGHCQYHSIDTLQAMVDIASMTGWIKPSMTYVIRLLAIIATFTFRLLSFD